jgi:hypothetical protein
VRDLRNDLSIPTMDDMRKANFKFTMSMLDKTIIAPVTIPVVVKEDIRPPVMIG